MQGRVRPVGASRDRAVGGSAARRPQAIEIFLRFQHDAKRLVDRLGVRRRSSATRAVTQSMVLHPGFARSPAASPTIAVTCSASRADAQRVLANDRQLLLERRGSITDQAAAFERVALHAHD
jgi:hypothetical protein